MSKLGIRLKELRKTRKLTQPQLAEKLNVGKSTVAMWETGDREPDYNMLQKIADFFNVSIDYLLGRPPIPPEGYPIDQELKIPLVGKIPAGFPIIAEERIEDYITVPNLRKYKQDQLFALRVQGDSMTGTAARIHPGDIVVVRVQPTVENGEIAVVNVDGENATLKRVRYLNGEIMLYSDNPKYPPMVVDSKRARICGKVVQVIFEPNAK